MSAIIAAAPAAGSRPKAQEIVASSTTPKVAVEPITTFQKGEDFIERHEMGTIIEMANEESLLKAFNESDTITTAWPIAPLPTCTAFARTWLFLVSVPSGFECESQLFPMIGDHFHIDMNESVVHENETHTLVYLSASRIDNPLEDRWPFLKSYAAFSVQVSRSWKRDDGSYDEFDLMSKLQVNFDIDQLEPSDIIEENGQRIKIILNCNSKTSDAELQALRFLTEEKRIGSRQAGSVSLTAFRALLDFKEEHDQRVDLRQEFPHMADPLADPLQEPARGILREHQKLADRFRAFNADHIAAYEGLFSIPSHRLLFVNGCPGSGKTEWNMVVSAILQSRKRPHDPAKGSPILFLVDINKTVDDAADRYWRLCKDVGLNDVRVIRMHGFPYEMRNSAQINREIATSLIPEGGEVDFTKNFLDTADLSSCSTWDRSLDRAPNLDEAAWHYFRSGSQRPRFATLAKLVLRLNTGEALNLRDWSALRNEVSKLYRCVLGQADFIATTPVAVSGIFAKLFKPDVIFIDEAPHARELTTLIPLAYFEPLVWIFSGDVHQTRPFVKSKFDPRDVEPGAHFNPYVRQLELSTMARAANANALHHRLMINKRAFGNLHRLPSELFYNGEMSSGHLPYDRFPQPTEYVRRILESLIGGAPLAENRLVIWLLNSQEKRQNNSFCNPAHREWVIKHAKDLLEDPNFQSVSANGKPGTVMVQAAYRAAVREYEAEIRSWRPDLRGRVEILTTDKSQGNQADFVFLDLVRSEAAGFMDDPKRLNVAISRARQGEVILMHDKMRWKKYPGVRTKNLWRLWEDSTAAHRVWRL